MANEARLKIIIDALNMAKGELGTLQKDLAGVESATKRDAGSFNVLKGSLTEIGSGIGIVKEAWAAYNTVMDATVNETVRYAAEVRELSRTIGASAEQASMLIQAADDVGISAQSVQGALEAAIRKGISPTIEGIAKLATEYNAIQDPIQRTEFLFDKFGRSGADLAPLMQLGARGIREAGEAARETGQVLSQEGVASARQYEIAMDDLSDRIEGLKIKLSMGLIPVLTRATDATTLILAWSDKLSAAYDEHSAQVAKTTRTYPAYIEQMNAGLDGTNKMIDASGNLWEVYGEGEVQTQNLAKSHYVLSQAEWEAMRASEGMNLAIEEANRLYPQAVYGGATWADSLKGQTRSAEALKIAQENLKTLQDAIINSMATLSLEIAGPVSKEMDSYNDKQADLAKQAAKIKAELDKLQKSQGAVAKSETKNAMSATELALAQAKVAAATDDLNHAQQGAKESSTDFALRVAQLKNDIADQTEKIGGANQSVTNYVDNSKRIGELKTEYDKVNLAIGQNADAHDEATKRIMFDLLSQRAAMGGLTTDEMAALNDIALQWGLVDQKTHDAVSGIDSALAGLAASGNIDAFIGKIGGIEAAARGADAAFQALMAKEASMHAGTGGAGALPTGPTGALALTGPPIHQAGGGDWIVTRPTLFLAGERDPERATFTPMGRAGNTHYQYNQQKTIIIDDRHTGALFLEMERRERQRAVDRSM